MKETRKISIGVFTILTVFLVYLSTVSNVAAIEHRRNYIDLESTVGPESFTYPGWSIDFIINEYPVSGRWTIRGVNDHDSVKIEAKCFYENNYNPAEIWPWISPSGYHFYSIATLYEDEPGGNSKDIETYAGQSGYLSLDTTVYEVSPGTSIYVRWNIYVENYITETSGEDSYQGWIDLLP